MSGAHRRGLRAELDELEVMVVVVLREMRSIYKYSRPNDKKQSHAVGVYRILYTVLSSASTAHAAWTLCVSGTRDFLLVTAKNTFLPHPKSQRKDCSPQHLSFGSTPDSTRHNTNNRPTAMSGLSERPAASQQLADNHRSLPSGAHCHSESPGRSCRKVS